jgi:prevent-host-death family protein
MKAVTIREAKARLNALVEAAERGEQIVLMRGSKHVAAIVPLSEEDLELAPSLSDAQAERLWQILEVERQEGAMVVYPSADAAVAGLRVADAPVPSKHRRSKGSGTQKR